MHSRPKTQQRKVTALADGVGANVGEEQRTECACVEVMVLWFIGEKAPIRVGGCLRNLPCAAARILPMPSENLPPVFHDGALHTCRDQDPLRSEN
jgi:hypothetical protein